MAICKATILHMMRFFILAIVLTHCAGRGGVSGNDGGSEPINETEAILYKKAIVRCYKNGGSRIVKLNGVLRCF